MNMILDRMRANLLPIVAGFLAVSLLSNAVLGYMLRQAWGREGALEAVLEVQKGETTEAKLANDTLSARIDEIAKSKQALVDQMARDLEQSEKELIERDQRIQAMTSDAIKERRKWNELINQEPECREFLNGSIADYCPDVAERVRQRSEGLADSLR